MIHTCFGDGWFPFDWWITPPNGLIKLIDADFNGLFDEANLQLVADGRSVANLRYGILHHHDFPRDAGGTILLSTSSLERNIPRFNLVRRHWKSLTGSVLFVRYSWFCCVPELKGIDGALHEPDLVMLPVALDRAFPDLDYRLLVVDSSQEIDDPRCLFRYTKDFLENDTLDAGKLDWPGNTAIWKRLFSSVDGLEITSGVFPSPPEQQTPPAMAR